MRLSDNRRRRGLPSLDVLVCLTSHRRRDNSISCRRRRGRPAAANVGLAPSPRTLAPLETTVADVCLPVLDLNPYLTLNRSSNFVLNNPTLTPHTNPNSITLIPNLHPKQGAYVGDGDFRGHICPVGRGKCPVMSCCCCWVVDYCAVAVRIDKRLTPGDTRSHKCGTFAPSPRTPPSGNHHR